MSEMKSSEDLAGYLGYVDGALKDGLLSEAEWTVKLESAPSYNLSAEQAQRLVIERCVEHGAVIEHVEIQKLRDLLAIAAPDKVLEASVQALLRRLAEERYRHTKLASPQAHVDRLVGERLGEAKLREEKPLRQKISERLHAAAGTGRSLRIEDWRRIYSGTLQELGISGGETSDLVGLFLDCRRELGIEIAEPEPPPPPPPSPLLEDEKRPLPPKPVVVEPPKSPSVLASLGKLVLISLVVAVLVFLLLRFFDRGAGSTDGVSVAVPYPRCDDDCATNLRRWNEALQQTPPSAEALEGAVQECGRYLSRDEEIKRIAKEKYPVWELCELSAIVEEFNKQSG